MGMQMVPNVLGGDNPEEEAKKIFQAGGANSDFLSGGGLNEDQQEQVWTFIRNYMVMLAPHYQQLTSFPGDSPIGRAAAQREMYRNGSSIGMGASLVPGGCELMVHSNGKISGTYDQAYIGESITRRAAEGTQRADQYSRNPMKFGRRRFETVKMQSAWGFTTEFISQNLQRGQLNAKLGAGLGRRMGQDYEDLFINGDEDAAPILDANGHETPHSELLRINDGLVKLTREQCPQFSADGEFVEWAHFVQATKMVPDEYGATGYKWWANPHLWTDWLENLSNRGAGAVESTMALGGIGLGPIGFPLVLVPSLPRQMPLTMIAAATSAHVIGHRAGPFSFPVDQFQISLNVDGAGAETIVFPTTSDPNVENRLLISERAAQVINAQYAAARGSQYSKVASVGQHGVLQLISPTSGAGSSIVIAAPANSALAILGLTAATTTGAAADGAAPFTNTINEGTVMWFGPEWNFVWHVNTADNGSDDKGLRMYVKFDQGSDKWVTDVYSYQDTTITAPEATVLIDNLRIARAGVSAINP